MRALAVEDVDGAQRPYFAAGVGEGRQVVTPVHATSGKHRQVVPEDEKRSTGGERCMAHSVKSFRRRLNAEVAKLDAIANNRSQYVSTYTLVLVLVCVVCAPSRTGSPDHVGIFFKDIVRLRTLGEAKVMPYGSFLDNQLGTDY